MTRPKSEYVYNIDGKIVGNSYTEKEFEKVSEMLDDYYDYKIAKKRSGLKGKMYTSQEISDWLSQRAK